MASAAFPLLLSSYGRTKVETLIMLFLLSRKQETQLFRQIIMLQLKDEMRIVVGKLQTRLKKLMKNVLQMLSAQEGNHSFMH